MLGKFFARKSFRARKFKQFLACIWKISKHPIKFLEFLSMPFSQDNMYFWFGRKITKFKTNILIFLVSLTQRIIFIMVNYFITRTHKYRAFVVKFHPKMTSYLYNKSCTSFGELSFALAGAYNYTASSGLSFKFNSH